MGAADYVILSLIALAVIFAVVYMAKRKKQGKCIGCGGDCAQCAYAVGDGGKKNKE
ncbi:MAG: FeoB-associated Cys-rich membrane protein [Clostridia bacterium]|nr:FeoB-associated Cys-rich membrane protein [Clostridia bacterium]